MSSKLHHNTAKKAAKFGLIVKVVEGEFVVYKGDVQLATHVSGSVAVDAAIAKLGTPSKWVKPKAVKKARKARDADEGDEGDEGDEDKSIVKRKYRERYKQFHGSCGDDLADQIRAAFEHKDEDGERRVDMKRFVAFAKANEVWVGAYAKLSHGLQRMNCANRLRAKIRKGYVVVWD